MVGIASYIQGPSDSTGKKVRNYQVTVGADDVQQQVVTLADSDGNVLGISCTSSTQPVTGTFWQATQPVSIAATVDVNVTDRAARDLGKVDIASLDQYTPVSGRLPVDGSGVTQPVSGTVAVTGVALDATQIKVNVGNLTTAATWQSVPTTAADLIGATVTIIGVHFNNNGSSAATITVKDKQGSPLTVVNTFSLPPLSCLTLPWTGTVFSGGLNWVAGTTGVVGSVVAYT